MQSRTTQLVLSAHAFAINKKIMTESVNPAKGSRPRIQLGNRKYGLILMCLADSLEDEALLWREKVKGMIKEIDLLRKGEGIGVILQAFDAAIYILQS